MAKTRISTEEENFKVENEVEIPNEEQNVEVAEKKSEDKGRVTEEVKVTNGVKKVKIHTTDVIDSIIGGVHYKFPKDRDQTVPSDVAAILCYGGKAYRN